jgi:hypothetical protein
MVKNKKMSFDGLDFHFGEEISSAFAQMKNKLKENCSMIQLSNEEWKQWIAIEELEKQFDLSIFEVLKLRRANLLAIGDLFCNI